MMLIKMDKSQRHFQYNIESLKEAKKKLVYKLT